MASGPAIDGGVIGSCYSSVDKRSSSAVRAAVAAAALAPPYCVLSNLLLKSQLQFKTPLPLASPSGFCGSCAPGRKVLCVGGTRVWLCRDTTRSGTNRSVAGAHCQIRGAAWDARDTGSLMCALPPAWMCTLPYAQDVVGELAELADATTPWARWSEWSDVAYTYSRGCAAGHTLTQPTPAHMVHA